jgi:predicted nucleotidyltransferase
MGKKMYSTEKIKEIKEKIRAAIQPDQIYLFGSYASGKPKENSDVDICIIKNNFKDKHAELLKVKMKIFDIGVPTDILLFDNENFVKRQNIWGSVQYEIFHKGVKMYEK